MSIAVLLSQAAEHRLHYRLRDVQCETDSISILLLGTWIADPLNVQIALLYTLYYVFRVRGSGKKADYKKGAPPEAKEGKDRKGAEEKV